ncbi:MAG: hypothetical protein ABSD43_08110 [Terracidiphilus sp.]|jgi:hypothetical protein
MKARFVSILFCVCIISGSFAASGQRLFPVQGPAATQAPPPAFTAKLTNIFKQSGKISLAQENGESFQGTWTIVTASFFNAKTPGSPASYPPQPNLAFAWDLVYGEGYYVGTILGSENVGQAMATGDRGTVLQVEFHREQLGVAEDNHFGVAVDNKGNIYKVVL